jgi:predicted O-methyltransferase YrrM
MTLCDIWGNMYGGSGRGGHAHIEQILKDMNYQSDVEFIDGDSRVELPKKIGELEYDLILVDGDHSYNGAWVDLWNSWKMLKEGGVMIFDDLLHIEHKYLLDCAENFAKISGAKEIYRKLDMPHGVIVWTKNKK